MIQFIQEFRKTTFWVFIGLSFLCFDAFSFQESIKLSELYQLISTTNESRLTIENKRLIDDLPKQVDDNIELFFQQLSSIRGVNIPFDSNGIITKVKSIEFIDSYGKDVSIRCLNIDSISILKGEFQNLSLANLNTKSLKVDSTKTIDEFHIANSSIEDYGEFENQFGSSSLSENQFINFVFVSGSVVNNEYYIMENHFENGAYFGVNMGDGFTDFRVFDNVFDPIKRDIIQYNSDSTDNHLFKTQLNIVHFNPVSQWVLEGNTFIKGYEEELIHLDGNVETLIIGYNDFGNTLMLDVSISKHWTFLENDFKSRLDITKVVLGAKNNSLDWTSMSGFKLSSSIYKSNIALASVDDSDTSGLWDELFMQNSELFYDIYNAQTNEELSQEAPYQELISSYYRLYKVFKENGQIKDANKVYIEMKDVQIRELKYLWKKEGGRENFINWRLNGLLRFYTDYGTNPARAINISLVVLFVFSIIYFFFPSEWDTKSKGQLVADYKVFVEKNDHGYFKPFMRLTKGFAISLINAMTLSLNSFVTLGFGSIPTTGLARYVCILQGFIGWFLLSIFTASLINQVMF